MTHNWQEMSVAAIREALAALDEAAQRAACEALLADGRKGVVALAERTLRAQARAAEERARVLAMWRYEEEAFDAGFHAVIGTDEVGRGPLAGPVVAAAVVLPRGLVLPGINDSKKLSEARREALAEAIRAQALAVAIAEASVEEIDRLNILHAAELAMQRAVAQLPVGDVVLVDGSNRLATAQPCRNIIGGDAASISIAAASIVAKVYRDHLMETLDAQYPGYGLAAHKGYGTAAHYDALRRLGPSPIHRRSFRLA